MISEGKGVVRHCIECLHDRTSLYQRRDGRAAQGISQCEEETTLGVLCLQRCLYSSQDRSAGSGIRLLKVSQKIRMSAEIQRYFIRLYRFGGRRSNCFARFVHGSKGLRTCCQRKYKQQCQKKAQNAFHNDSSQTILRHKRRFLKSLCDICVANVKCFFISDPFSLNISKTKVLNCDSCQLFRGINIL